jgi:hypothetical protein
MTKEEKAYTDAGEAVKNAEASQMFGKPCYKVNGKAFLCFFEKAAVFKLTGKEHEFAMGLKGSVLFDPSAKGRPMKEWVQVTFQHQKEWLALAKASAKYVLTSAK